MSTKTETPQGVGTDDLFGDGRPPAARAPAYWAWRDRLESDPAGWRFTDREEAIAFAAFIAGWYLRTGQDPDCHFAAHQDQQLGPPTNVMTITDPSQSSQSTPEPGASAGPSCAVSTGYALPGDAGTWSIGDPNNPSRDDAMSGSEEAARNNAAAISREIDRVTAVWHGSECVALYFEGRAYIGDDRHRRREAP